MDPVRFESITSRFSGLRIAVMGDFCLDRYLEIDTSLRETSIETGLPVFNVVNVRGQPGGCGTILSNLVALGIGKILPIGFAGEDAEGWELQRALREQPGVDLGYFFQTRERRTFTYIKPLAVTDNDHPTELNRLDIKNWSPTPAAVSDRLAESVEKIAGQVDAIILLDQVDVPDTGVITKPVLEAIERTRPKYPQLLIVADSRSGLNRFPPVVFKMNRDELARCVGADGDELSSLEDVGEHALALSRKNGQHVFVTLAQDGMLGATPTGQVEHVPPLITKGEIDIVGAGDAVTANVTAALAAGACLRESMLISSAAAAVVLGQLGTTGSATVDQIAEVLR